MKTSSLIAALLLVFSLSTFARTSEDTKPAASTSMAAASYRGGDRAYNVFRMELLNQVIRTGIRQQLPAGSYNVVLTFEVDARGNVNNVQATSAIGFGLEEKAVALFGKSPRWTPAQKSGHKVKAAYTENFRFEVM